MANPFFKFKQFMVRHDKCAMKVGTDGVLLGAWVRTENAKRILDIGTGTGLIALMLAQRSDARIDAIDIDISAFQQASENVCSSSFAKQIEVYHSSFSDFMQKTNVPYDLIVSNPPYFTQSLKSPDDLRTKARHDDSLPLDNLITGAKSLLAETGRLALILPIEHAQRLDDILVDINLYKIRQTNVAPVIHGNIRRILVEISAQKTENIKPDLLTIEKERHVYTEEYRLLTKDFYLNI